MPLPAARLIVRCTDKRGVPHTMQKKSLAVFTSIPASIERRDRLDRDIGPDYLERCIRSWRDAGHRVVSVNTAEEAATLTDRFVGVEFHRVERSAVAIVGRPLVYIADVIAACAAAPEEVVGIVNADLYLDAPKRLDGILSRIDGSTLIYAQRLDVDDVDDPREAEPYFWGMDCFLFSPAMARDIADEGLVFGECWWDYWLPIVLAKRGYRLELAGPPPFIKHLQHGDNGLTAHTKHYLEGLGSFLRALSVRLPLPGADPWIVQANACFSALQRQFNASADPAESVLLVHILALVAKLYLHGDPDLIATVREFYADWSLPAYPILPRFVLDPLYRSVDNVATNETPGLT
jgi:hypothetical protein